MNLGSHSGSGATALRDSTFLACATRPGWRFEPAPGMEGNSYLGPTCSGPPPGTNKFLEQPGWLVRGFSCRQGAARYRPALPHAVPRSLPVCRPRSVDHVPLRLVYPTQGAATGRSWTGPAWNRLLGGHAGGS